MWAISIVNTLDKDYNVIFFTTKHNSKQQTSMIYTDRANTHIYEKLEYYTLKPHINGCTSQGFDVSLAGCEKLKSTNFNVSKLSQQILLSNAT